MRRLFVGVGAAALGLALAVPVARAVPADQNHNMSFWTPYDNNGTAQPDTAPDNASVFSTDEVVTVRLEFTDGVKSWDVRLQPVSGGPASTCHEDIAKASGQYPLKVYVNCPWDTTRVVDRTLDQPTPGDQVGSQMFQRNWHLYDHGPSANGKYWIQVTAHSAGQSCLIGCSWDPSKEQDYELYEPNTNPARSRQVWVTNDVAAPTGVAAAYDAGAGRIHVTWAPNPEPDVSYVVQEKVGSNGKWSSGAAVPGSATTYDRTIDQPGNYQYRVSAVRPAPTADSGSGASATKQSGYVAAQAVQIDQVTPPTTAGGNGPDGTIDHSGDGGVFIPTDPTSAPGPGSGGPGRPTVTSAGGHSSGAVPGSHVSGPSNRSTGSTAAGGGEAEGEGPDGGFSSTLPYGTQDGSTDGLGNGDEEPQSMSPFVNVPKPRDTRAVLVPLAGGLAMFMLAMQVTVLLRRRPAMATVEDDFDDWLGL